METDQRLLDRIAELENTIKTQNKELEILEAALDLSEVGFTISDANGVVIKINPSQIRITGHKPEITLGRSMADIESENNNRSATMQVVETKKPVTIEQVLPSGKSYLVYGQPYFHENGQLKYVICNLVDNTQHNYTRQELEAAKSSNLQLTQTIKHLQEIVDMQKTLVYCSKKMQKIMDMCDKIAHFNSTILISGESGTGKELIANYIFNKSTRTEKPFIKINCAAIPENLLESELFGYDAGAFTNARTQGKKGIFEVADGGTVLLDEIGELPLHLQSKILRVLQEGEFYHVGGTVPISTDVRIIASTNRNLEEMTHAGTFRQDLFYRLSVIRFTIPALNERREDIPLLIRHFLIRFNEKHGLQKELTFEAMEYLKELPYKGNVRDLQNIIERIVLLSYNNIIGVQDVMATLNPDFYDYENPFINPSVNPLVTQSVLENPSDISLKDLVTQYEKTLLQKYWMEYKSASKIAEILKTNQPTISRKLHTHGII